MTEEERNEWNMYERIIVFESEERGRKEKQIMHMGEALHLTITVNKN